MIHVGLGKTIKKDVDLTLEQAYAGKSVGIPIEKVVRKSCLFASFMKYLMGMHTGIEP